MCSHLQDPTPAMAANMMCKLYEEYLHARAQSKRKDMLEDIKTRRRHLLYIRPRNTQTVFEKLVIAQLRLSGNKRDKRIAADILKETLGTTSPTTFKNAIQRFHKNHQQTTSHLAELVIAKRMNASHHDPLQLGTLAVLPADILYTIAKLIGP